MKKIYVRLLSCVLVFVSLFINCIPRAFAGEVSSTISVAIGNQLNSGVESDVDESLALAGLSYFASNGIDLISYNQTGETLVDTFIRYFKQYYQEQIVGGGSVSDFYDWIANGIINTALGIRRVSGALNSAFDILITEPLLQKLSPFMNWFNNKFNPSDSTAEQTVEISRDFAVSSVVVPLVDGSSFSLSVQSDGQFFPDILYPNYFYPLDNVAFGMVLFPSENSVRQFNSIYFRSTIAAIENSYNIEYSLNGNNYTRITTLSNDTDCYLSATASGILLGRVSDPYYKFIDSSDRGYLFPYSYFYSTPEQFSNSGVSVLATSVSSDGSLSYGPDTSSADNIVQNNQTLSVPVIAPSVSGDSSLSFETTDSLSELLEKALSIVTAFLSDASDNTLQLPSNDSSLPPDIDILDNLDIDWAGDSQAVSTPTPTPTESAIVTVAPTSVPVSVTPWPVSDPQLAVVGSDGTSTIVDIVATIKSWTGVLTDIYQGYVDLMNSVFPFVPDEIKTLLNWSLAAVIFTGIFKRWWWSHH